MAKYTPDQCQRCGKPKGVNPTKNHCRPCAKIKNATNLASQQRERAREGWVGKSPDEADFFTCPTEDLLRPGDPFLRRTA